MSEKERPAYLGHRERVRQKIEEFGFVNLSDVDLLEYLLFFCLPRCDTYTLSRNLIKEFGTLREVLNASKKELCEIKGIGKESAIFLNSFIPVFKAYHAGSFILKKPLLKLSDLLTFLRVQTLGAKAEMFQVLYFDSKHILLKHELYTSDDWSLVAISMDKIIRKAISLNSPIVLVAHNHLGYNVFPSEEDINSASVLKGKFDTVGITLEDSIIYNDNDYYSLFHKNANSQNKK